MTAIPTLTLGDGNSIPRLGLGVWQIPDDRAADVVADALAAGYRSLDTATVYRNEVGVGLGIRRSGLPREEVHVTTKVWNKAHGFDTTIAAFRKSLDRLDLDYVDLYLIHWPVPAHDRYVETWRALLALQADGLVRSVGVSNFLPAHLDRLGAETGTLPVINQVELHPHFQQAALRAYHAERGIATEAWSPLGQGRVLADPVIAEVAARHGVTPAQAIIRWHVQLGNVVIPKSADPARLRENLDVFGFELDDEDLSRIAHLETGRRIGGDPETVS